MFIEQAYKGDNTAWKVILTTLLASGIFLLNFVVLAFLSEEERKAIYDSMKGFPNNFSLFINLLPFAFLLGFLFLMVYFLHNRSILSLTTTRNRVDFKRVFTAFGLIVVFSAVSFGIGFYLDDSNIVWNFKPLPFALLLIISLLLFPFQIGFEEYLFRGYLMQQLGIAVRNRWFPLVVTSVIFGLFHSANPEVAEMGFGVMAFYIGTGLLLGVMTLMDDGMELALGFHLGNNLMAALLITSEFAALQTDAVFKYTAEIDTSDTLGEMLITIAITYPLILLILARIYKWTNWSQKLTGQVKPPAIITYDDTESNIQ